MFVSQSAAMGRWGQNEDKTQSSPVHGSSTSPRSIRPRDSDEESPCCKTCWARSPRMTNVLAALMSPTAVDPDAIIYDGRNMAGRVVGRLRQEIWSRQACQSFRVTLILIWRMRSADFNRCRRLFRHYLQSVWWVGDIAVTISGASDARHALGSYFYESVSGTDPGGILSWDNGCVPDICSISRCLVLRPDDFASVSCTDCGH